MKVKELKAVNFRGSTFFKLVELLATKCADALENAEEFETDDYKMFKRQRKAERMAA